MNRLTLNFLKLATSDFKIVCFRRLCLTECEMAPTENVHQTRFYDGVDGGTQTGRLFWVSDKAVEGFESYVFKASRYVNTALWILRRRVLPDFASHIRSLGAEVETTEGPFPKLNVKVKRCDDECDDEGGILGYQGFRCAMEWLPSAHAFGLFVNFHFFCAEGFCNHRMIQELSFSLDANGLPNRDYHVIVRAWLQRFHQKFGRTFSYESPVVSEKLSFSGYADGSATLLPPRSYEFEGCRSDLHPYWGVKKFGPYRKPALTPTFVFVFRELYREEARILFRSLAGTEFPDKFSGMKDFFGVDFGARNVVAKVIKETSVNEYERVATEIIAEGYANPVCVDLHSGEASQYYFLKTIFLKHGIPCQVVMQDTVRRGKGFQWAVAGLGVQLFAKAGGYPWRVKTQRRDTLIVGLSQTIEFGPNGAERFIAYSVATDASGVFRSVRTLANDQNEVNYAKGLGDNLKRHLRELINGGTELPKRVVLHCSFRLSNLAMSEVRDAIAACRREDSAFPNVFVMRINTRHDYFGFDDSNAARVPRENSLVRIGKGRYLLWTEGVVQGRALTGRISNPVYVVFDHVSGELDIAVEKELLEDLCCLSGANWRGFHARTRPVSVLYCELVGDFIRNIRDYANMGKKNLVLPDVEQFVPWFL